MSFESQQENWNRLAEVDPMWAILSEPDKLGGKWDEEGFYGLGVTEAWKVTDDLDELGLWERGCTVLDVGCGIGRVTHAFHKHFGMKATGYDLSPRMLEIARERDPEGPEFVLNETDDLSPFEDESFDFVYCNRVLQHIDPDRLGDYTSEMVRVLKPGGVLWLQMLSHPTGDRDPSRESSPLPEWAENGHLPQYTICCVPINVMMSGFMELGLVVHMARLVEGGKGQSFYSYEYVLQVPE